MDFAAQGLAHLPAADICDCVQGKAVEELIMVQEVLSYAVDNQMQELVLLVKK